MSGMGKIIGVLSIVIALGFIIFGASLMFVIVPNMAENATLPTDFDDHNVYGGYLTTLNTATGEVERTNFTIDRRIHVIDELPGGKLLLDEDIKAVVNGTDIEIPDLAKHNEYEIDELTMQLFKYEELDNGIVLDYTEEDDVQWIFPHPVDKDADYSIFNMNILNYSQARYIGTEDVNGVECYVFKGGEVDYEIPIPASTAEALGSMAPESTMMLTLWEKAWVHPLTGSIIDYAKEIDVYLYLPELPPIPEIKYPSDLVSTTGFDGDLIIFDQATASFNSFDGISAERYIEVISEDGYDLTANETVTVLTSEGASLSMLDSAIQIVFDARDGTHTGPGRTGQYLFSPQGAGEMNYSIWDDGFGMEVNAEYIGNDNATFEPLAANIYHVYVENETYRAGGKATLDMTYWVEPMTGIVLDVNKKVSNWREQDARRLPLDTALINKTITLNVTITAINPIDQSVTPMEIYVEQIVNCTGYTNTTYGVAMFTEKVTKYLPNGTMMAPPTVANFSVDAYTMAYVDTTRTGVFTFPIGLLNETGDVTPSYTMFNSDLGMSFPAVLVEEMEMQGLQVAKYEMNLSEIPLTYPEVVGILGQDPGLPGATGTYGCLYEYYVDINTGTIIDITRSVAINMVPPTYEFLYDNMDSVSVVKGELLSENITMTQTMIGSEAGEGTTLINITKTVTYDNGTDFMDPEVIEVLINTTSHEMLLPNGTGLGLYLLFPPSPNEAAYPMMYSFGGVDFIGAAMKGDMTETTVDYNFSSTQVIDAEIFGMPGVGANMTLGYNFLVDRNTGMVLDVNIMVNVENNSIGLNMDLVFLSQNDPADTAMSNAVMGWALSGVHAPVLDISMDLYDMEAEAAVMKAKVTSQLLLIADGVRPALELELSFNATTKATMLATAQGTIGLLEQLPLLQGAHMMNGLLEANDNMVQHVYYKKVDTDVGVFEDVDGSVEYWADKAKESEDKIERYGVVLPTALYVLGGIGIVIGLVLIVAKGKKTEEAEE